LGEFAAGNGKIRSFNLGVLINQKLPAWSKDTCTTEYIRLLATQVKVLFEGFQQRKKFLEAIRQIFGGA
jgi:hypothetical protein